MAKFLGASGLRELNIEDIGLGAVGFKELEEKLPREIALSFINIRLVLVFRDAYEASKIYDSPNCCLCCSKNRGGIRTAYFLSRLISQAPNLVSINAGANIMPPESVNIICDALKLLKGMRLSSFSLCFIYELACELNHLAALIKKYDLDHLVCFPWLSFAI